MARLTKTAAREPLAEHHLMLSTHENAQERVFDLYVKADETGSGKARYYKLTLSPNEARRVALLYTEYCSGGELHV